MADFISALVQLLSGTPTAAGAVPESPIPAGSPRMPLPQEAPVPMQRPATLPGGTFTPQREPDMASVPAAASQNPLMQLFGGEGGGLRDMLRAAGAGMGNLGNSGGDPYVAFGQGFGGATGYKDKQDAAAKAEAAGISKLEYDRLTDAEKLQYDRQQDAGKTQREIDKNQADLELRRMSEERQAKSSALNDQKTALEIRRDARTNGVTIAQQIEIERVAQAAGENMYNADERKQAIDETRQRLVDQITSGQGITGKSGGLSGNSTEQTATGPNGEKLVLRNGAWEPM